MPDSIQIKRCIRKEPNTREDLIIQRLKREGILPCSEKRMYRLPKAPGVFSLGPDIEPVQIPNSEVVQPITKNLDTRNLQSFKNYMSNLF